MDWKKTLGNLAPTIGSAFGPLGTAGGLAIRELLGMDKNASDEAVQAFVQTPEGALKAKQAEYDYKLNLAKEDTLRITAVNASMQDESKSEHWMQWSWRPFNGFLFGITLFCNYAVPMLMNSLVLPFLGSSHTIQSGSVPEGVFMAWGAVLGVTAWHRGLMQVEKIKVSK